MNTQGNINSKNIEKVPLTQYSEVPLTDDTEGFEPQDVKLPPYSPAPEIPVNVTVPPLTNRDGFNKAGQVVSDPPMDNIHLAIFTMICCCWPCGLVGLLTAIKALQAHYHGDSEAAELANKKARKWIIRSIIAGVITALALSINGLVRGLIYGLTAGNDSSDMVDIVNATATTVAY